MTIDRYTSLAVRLLQRDQRFRRALLVIGTMVSGLVVAMMVLTGSVERAVLDGTRADYAGYQSFLQVVHPAGVAALDELPTVRPAWVTAATVTASRRSTPISLRVSEGRLPLVTMEGRKPTTPEEIALTPAVLGDLGTNLGDELQVTTATGAPRRLRVVGTLVDPRDRSVRAGVMHSRLPDQEPTVWLSDDDVFAEPSIQAELEAGSIRGRSVELLARDQLRQGPSPVIRAVRTALPAIFAVVLALGAVLTWSLTRSVDHHVKGLVAAGMADPSARRVVHLAAVLGLGVTAIGAAVLVALTIWLSKSVIDRAVNQYWLGLGLNWPATAAAILLIPLTTMAVVVGLQRISRIGLRVLRASATLVLALVIAGGGLIVLPGVIRAHRELALIGGAILTAGGAGLSAMLLGYSRRRVKGRIASHLVASALGPALLVCVATFCLSTYAATTAKGLDAAEESTGTLQPTGSIMVDGVGRPVVDAVVDVFRDAGGERELLYELADDTTRRVRVTSAGVAACYRSSDVVDPDEVLQRCGPPGTLVPINVVAFSDAVTDETALAIEPALSSGGDAGFLYPPGPSGGRWRTIVVENQAESMPGLGGNLPAALFPPDSELARSLGITRGGGFGVVLFGLDRLPPRRQAEVRYAVAQLAGSAGVSEAQHLDQSGERELLSVVAVAGSAFLGAMLWSIGRILVSTHAETLTRLAALGATRRYRLGIMARILCVPLLLIAWAVAVSRLIAQVLVPVSAGSYGLLWLLPLGAALPVLALLLLVESNQPVGGRP